MDTLPEFIQIGIALGGLTLSGVTALYVLYLHRKEKQLHDKEHAILITGSKLIDHAQNKANVILESAADKAKETLMQTQFIKASAVKDLNEALQKVSDTTIEKFKEQSEEFNKQYRDLLEQMKKEYAANARGTIGLLDKAVTEEVEDFRKILKDETVNSQAVLDRDVNEAFSQAKHEIEAYKKARVQDIDVHLNKVLSQILSTVLHKSLSDSDHEKLVVQALEQARKEGVFGTLGNATTKTDTK